MSVHWGGRGPGHCARKQSASTPAVVLATKWNPTDIATGVTLSNNDLTATVQTAELARATTGKSTGKWYFEWSSAVNNAQAAVGFSGLDTAISAGNYAATIFLWWVAAGNTWIGSGWGNLGGAPVLALAEVGGLAADFDAGKVWVRDSAGWDGDPLAGTGGYTLAALTEPVYPLCGAVGGAVDNDITVNFGATAFAYSLPTGFASWNSA